MRGKCLADQWNRGVRESAHATFFKFFVCSVHFFICSNHFFLFAAITFLFAAFTFLFAAFTFLFAATTFLFVAFTFLFAAFTFLFATIVFSLQRVPCGPSYYEVLGSIARNDRQNGGGCSMLLGNGVTCMEQ